MIEIYATQDVVYDRIGFHMVERRDGLAYVAKPLVLESFDLESSPCSPDPAFRLKPDECQRLMDELWRVGVRPSEGSGSAGAIRQAEAHIKSLNRITFNLVDSNS